MQGQQFVAQLQLRLTQELSASQSSIAKTANLAAPAAEKLAAVHLHTAHVLLAATATGVQVLVCFVQVQQLLGKRLAADAHTGDADMKQTWVAQSNQTPHGTRSCCQMIQADVQGLETESTDLTGIALEDQNAAFLDFLFVQAVQSFASAHSKAAEGRSPPT